MQMVIGRVNLNDTMTAGADLRIAKYEIIDYLNQVTSKIIAELSEGEVRYQILSDLKRAKELVNNL